MPVLKLFDIILKNMFATTIAYHYVLGKIFKPVIFYRKNIVVEFCAFYHVGNDYILIAKNFYL